MSAPDRFWAKVTGDAPDECWMWQAYRNASGYGQFGVARGDIQLAHRWSWEHFNGRIPDGLHLDHLCRNRACVNPWHLEPVTQAENNRRAAPHRRWEPLTECSNGHALTPENQRPRADRPGKFYCRKCQAASQRRYYERRQEAS